MLLADAVDAFLLQVVADGKSPRTAEAYRWSLTKLARVDPRVHVERLAPERLVAWMVKLREIPTATGRPLSAASLRNAFTALKAFSRWLESVGKADPDRPLDARLRRPVEPDPEIYPFSRDEVARILMACQWQRTAQTARRKAYRAKRHTGQRDVALVLFLLDTGVRVGEMSRVNVGDYDQAQRRVWIAPHGSGRKSAGRFVYVGESVGRLLGAMIVTRKARAEDPLFLTRDGLRLERFAVKNLMYQLERESGVTRVHAHRFRHTMAIEYLRNGGDVFTLQRLLGHRDLDTTRRYLRFVEADMGTTHRRASPVANWGL